MAAEDSKWAYSAAAECRSHSLSSIPGDVYPMHTFDGSAIHRTLVAWTMCFNDVLDPNILHDGLSRLLEIGDWAKLGGRVRYKENGKLEIHVPQPFTAEQPAVAFSRATFDMRLEDHPVASRFPQQTDRASVQEIPREFRSFIVREDYPTTVEEMIHQNAPQISLHITSFNDATLVGLAWTHTLTDAIGLQALLHGWSLVLAGQEEKVPSVLGARDDILLEAENATPNKDQGEFVLEQKRLTGVGRLMYIVRSLWAKFWNPPWELRSIFLPSDAFARLKTRTREEVAKATVIGADTPFVSEGDILTGWVTSVVASTDPRSRPVTIGAVSNARYRLPLLLQSGGVYVQNMLFITYAFISAQLAGGPAGPIALSHRSHLAEQCTEEQTLHSFKAMRREIEARGTPRFEFGDSDASVILFNNLTKVDVIKSANFGPAVLHQGENKDSRRNPLGTMKTFFARNLSAAPPPLNFFSMLGKDHAGNYWLSGSLLPRAWAKMEEELRNL